MAAQTRVAVEGERFSINGRPTYEGRRYRDWSVEGLLLNARVVNAIFDDLNPQTRGRWAYPDTGVWDLERNVREFLEQLPVWRQRGLLGITVNLQGGSPEGYSRQRSWGKLPHAAARGTRSGSSPSRSSTGPPSRS